MPPKAKVTRDEIVKTAVDIVRKTGMQAINARNIASQLNCSTQPIFSNFSSMDELRHAVCLEADKLCREYMQREMESGKYPVYKAHGMAYIRFAKEESELFKLLYMRDRNGSSTPEETDLTDNMETIIHSNTGLGGTDAKLFHLEMWAYVHGIATMFATSYLNLDWDLVSQMLTDSYQGLRKLHSPQQ